MTIDKSDFSPNMLWTTTLRRFTRQLSSNTGGQNGAKVLMHFNFPPC